jgi:negative regulator of genetic competence, sporulation and motility
MKLLGIISVGFDVTNQLLIKFLHSPDNCRKKLAWIETVHYLFVDFKKAYDSVRREVLYSILVEFGVPMKLVRLKRIALVKSV